MNCIWLLLSVVGMLTLGSVAPAFMGLQAKRTQRYINIYISSNHSYDNWIRNMKIYHSIFLMCCIVAMQVRFKY
jgi:hypothetical protein